MNTEIFINSSLLNTSFYEIEFRIKENKNVTDKILITIIPVLIHSYFYKIRRILTLEKDTLSLVENSKKEIPLRQRGFCTKTKA